MIDRALGQQLSFSQYNHRVTKAGNKVHIVLDQKKRTVIFLVQLFDQRNDIIQCRTINAGADLIKQNNPCTAHQCATQFQQFFLSSG